MRRLNAGEVRAALTHRGVDEGVAESFETAEIDSDVLGVLDKVDLDEELGIAAHSREAVWSAVEQLRTDLWGPPPAKRAKMWLPAVGSRVVAQGLVHAQDLNGEEGEVVRLEGERVVINFEWFGEKSLRPESLKLAAAGPAPPAAERARKGARLPVDRTWVPFVGDKVVVHELPPDDPFLKALNGEEGVVTAVAPGIVTVRFDAKPPFERELKPANLMPWEEAKKRPPSPPLDAAAAKRARRARLREERRRREAAGGGRKLESFQDGEEAEVVILSGTFKGKWVPCTIVAEEGLSQYTIHITPTDRFGGAAGASDKRLEGVHAKHLRKKPKRSSMPSAAAAAAAEAALQEQSVQGKYWDSLSYVQKKVCINAGIVPQPPTCLTDIWEAVDNVNRARLADAYSIDHPGQLIVGRDPEPAGRTRLAQHLRGMDALWAGVGDDDVSSIQTESADDADAEAEAAPDYTKLANAFVADRTTATAAGLQAAEAKRNRDERQYEASCGVEAGEEGSFR